MQVTETRAEGLKREYKVVVPAEDIENAVEHRLEEVSKTAEIKGFRKGKVPVFLVRQRYGTSVLGDVVEQAVARSSRQLMQDKGVRPALEPKIEITRFAEGADLEYTMALEVLPEIVPCDFGKLELTRLKVEVTDAEVERALRRIADQEKRFTPVASGRASRHGDLLVIDFAGSLDGEPMEGGRAEDFQVHLGSGAPLPGFDDQLVGTKAGDHARVSVDFPEDYPRAQVAGKTGTFEVDVKEVREPEDVEVDEDFAKRRGFDELSAFKEAVRRQLEVEYSALARSRLKRDLFDRLAETHDFQLPEGMVEREFERIWSQLTADMERNKASFEDLGKSEEETRAEYHRVSERRVRLGLLLSELGRRHGITVDRSEMLKMALQSAARQFSGQEEKIAQFYRDNPGALEQFRPPVLEDKVVDFILEIAKVTERPVSADKLSETLEADEKAASEAPESREKRKEGKPAASSRRKSKTKAARAGKAGSAAKPAGEKPEG